MSIARITPISAQYSREMASRTAGTLLSHRKLLIVLLETFLIIFSYYGSLLLRFGPSAEARATFLNTLALLLLVKLVLFFYFGLFHGWWRYTGISDLLNISRAAATASCIFFLAEVILRQQMFSVSVVVTDLALTVLLLGGARLAVRAYTENVQSDATGKNTLVVGAGQAGSTIIRELKRNPGLDYRLVGLVDDDPSKQGIKC